MAVRAFAVLCLLNVAVIGTYGGVPAAAEARSLLFVRPQPSGPPRSTVTLVGLGFDPAPIEIRWGSIDGRQLDAGSGPDFSVDLTVPEVSAGLYTIVAVSRGPKGELASAASTTFLVTPSGSHPPQDELSPAATVAQPGSAAAATPTSPIVWAAIGAVVLGLAVVALRRRRLSTPEPVDAPSD